MSLNSRLLLASLFPSGWLMYRQRGRSEYLRQSPFSLKICRPWGQCAVTVLSAQGTRWGTGACRAQWALAVGYSAVGTKSRMTPGILKVVECRSTWRAVLPALERKILNTKPEWASLWMCLHSSPGWLGRGAAGALVVWKTAFWTQQ